MYRDFLLLLQSAGGGIFSTSIYLLGGYILDYFMNAKYSNFIALLISAVVNFVMQTRTFVGKRGVNNNSIEKYFVSEIIIITLSQLGLIYLINHKKDYTRKVPKKIQAYYTTIARIIAASMVFIFISFPLRKFWVFI